MLIHGNDNHQQLTTWFDRLWQEAEDFDAIQNNGGAFVSDVVGLGKSFIGAAIIKWMEQHERTHALIICPPPLIDMSLRMADLPM